MITNHVQGFMRLVARKADGSERVAADWFPNLITNAGMNRLGAAVSATHAWVGSGSNAPQFTDADLQSPISKAGAFVGALDANGAVVASGYGWFRRTFRFAAGEATGNVSEVAIGWSNTSGMFSRALVKDALGAPTVVTILPDESLDVVYEFRIYWPVADVQSNAVITGTTYAVTIRPMQIGNWGIAARDMLTQPNVAGAFAAHGDAALGANDVGPGGVLLGNLQAYTIDAYVNDTFQNIYRCTWSLSNITAASNVRNFGLPTPRGLYKMRVDPMMLKDGNRILGLALAVGWSRRVI